MTAYLIVDTKINDEELYEEYKIRAKPIVESYGGEYLVRGGFTTVSENELWTPTRLVVVRFPSREAAENFLCCPLSRAFNRFQHIQQPRFPGLVFGHSQ